MKKRVPVIAKRKRAAAAAAGAPRAAKRGAQPKVARRADRSASGAQGRVGGGEEAAAVPGAPATPQGGNPAPAHGSGAPASAPSAGNEIPGGVDASAPMDVDPSGPVPAGELTQELLVAGIETKGADETGAKAGDTPDGDADAGMPMDVEPDGPAPVGESAEGAQVPGSKSDLDDGAKELPFSGIEPKGADETGAKAGDTPDGDADAGMPMDVEPDGPAPVGESAEGAQVPGGKPDGEDATKIVGKSVGGQEQIPDSAIPSDHPSPFAAVLLAENRALKQEVAALRDELEQAQHESTTLATKLSTCLPRLVAQVRRLADSLRDGGHVHGAEE